jgi:formate hydrogenlyase subunit 3/multisubunit Na+/H+ antiporter MnhD subunit
MGSTPWLMIIILILIVVLGITALFVAKTRKEKRPIDYYAFFWMGLIWTVFGLFFYQQGNFSLLGMGVVFLIVGLVNKDKWEKNRIRWSDLNKKEQNLKLTIIGILGVLVLAGMVAFLLVQNGVLGN